MKQTLVLKDILLPIAFALSGLFSFLSTGYAEGGYYCASGAKKASASDCPENQPPAPEDLYGSDSPNNLTSSGEPASDGDCALPEFKGNATCAKLCAMAEYKDNANCKTYASNSKSQSLAAKSKDIPEDTGSSTDTGTTSISEARRKVCQDALNAMVQSCSAAASKTSSSCDQGKVSTAASVATLAGGQVASASIKNACSTMGKALGMANIALVSFKQICQVTLSSCSSSCVSSRPPECSASSEDDLVASASDALKSGYATCREGSNSMQVADAAMQNIQLEIANAQHCELLTSGSVPTPQACVANPNLAGCSDTKVDCSSPEMASNKVCVCSRNPNSPSCISVAKAKDGVNLDTSKTVVKMTSDPVGPIGGADAPKIQGSSPIAKDSGIGGFVDGKQGGGANLGSNNGGNLTVEKPTKRSTNKLTPVEVNDGFYASTSTASDQIIGGSSDDSKSPIKRKPSATTKDDSTPDLSRFLPKAGTRPAWAIGGSVGVDGISGPNANIWQNIQNRYRSISPTLYP